MSTEQNKASVRRLIEEVFNKGNLAAAEGMVAPSLVLAQLPPGTPPGLESLTRLVTRARTAFPDFHITIEDQVAEGNRIAFRCVMSGTQLGPYLNDLKTSMPPTGKRFSVQGLDIWRFDGDGKWAECWSTYDRLARLQQLGALPAAGPHPSEAAPATPTATLAG
jgi:predicted ester cyclase